MAPMHQTLMNDLSYHLFEVINFQDDKMHDDIYKSIILN